MKIRKEQDTKLKLDDNKISVAGQELKKGGTQISRNLNTLNGQGENEEQSPQNDVRRYLRPKELQKWNRLNSKQRERYLKKARHRMEQEPSVSSQSLHYESQTSKGDQRSVGRGPTINRETSSINTATKMAQSSAKKAAETGTKAVATVGAGAATGGAAVVAKTSKKAANKFVESLQQKEELQKIALQSLHENGRSRIEQNKNFTDLGGALGFIAGVGTVTVASLASALVSVLFAILITLFSVIGLILIALIAAVILYNIFNGQSGGGEDMVKAAIKEYEAADQNVGGGKYKRWFEMDADWCTIFISYLGEQCGLVEEGIIPKESAVINYKKFYEQKGLFKHKNSGYRPKSGDLVIWKEGAGYNPSSHIGIVIEYDQEFDRITTIEGNSGKSKASPYHAGSRVTKNTYPRISAAITGYATPEYPVGNSGAKPLTEGESISIPAGLGDIHTYMGWQTITSPSSKQYKLREEAGQNFDSEGFARIGSRYVIACTTTYGEVGDYIDFYQEDGTVIECIIGDIKNQSDPGCNNWGHQNGQCIIEFVVDKNSWYGTGHANPGTSRCHPEWDQYKTKAVNRGSYWGN